MSCGAGGVCGYHWAAGWDEEVRCGSAGRRCVGVRAVRCLVALAWGMGLGKFGAAGVERDAFYGVGSGGGFRERVPWNGSRL